MHMRALVIVALLATAAHASAAPSRRGARHDTGFRLGARLGVAIPMGDIAQNMGLSDSVSANLPIWLDAAYRFSPNFSAGIYFNYGFGFASNCPAGVSCSTHSVHLGAESFYHFLPRNSFDPYIGLGTGWEWMSLGASAGAQSLDYSFNGWEFLTFQAGGDFSVAPQWAVGPYLALSLGQYSNCGLSQNGVGQQCRIASTAVHEWFQFGVRGTFDF